jgi:hypothetical protein
MRSLLAYAALLLGFIVAVLYIPNDIQEAYLSTFGFAFLATLMLCIWLYDRAGGPDRLQKAKAFSLPDAVQLMRSDPRSSVLLLRSFADDGAEIGQRAADRLDVIGFEESLQRYLSGYGPVIAVADPYQPPHRGAARVYLPDEEWQHRVLAWMDKAVLIVVLIGATDAAKWELAQIVVRNHLSKCVVLVPPGQGSRERLTGAIEPFLGSRWQDAILQLSARGDRLRAFYCRPSGKVTVFWSREWMALDYLVALAFSIYGLFCHRRSANGSPV